MITEINNSWIAMPIEDILAPNEKGVILGQGWSPQCEKQPSQSENDWGVLKTTAIQSGYFLEVENKLLPFHLEPRAQHEVKTGDLLITCAGPRNRCGVACLVRKTRSKLLISGKMYRFRINEKKAIPEFVELFLISQEAWKEIDKMKTGGSDSGLNLTHSRFKKLVIPIPPLNEQKAIVSKIEELVSDLENGKQQLQTGMQQLKVYRQSLLKWAFEGKLSEGWRNNQKSLTTPTKILKKIQAEKEKTAKATGKKLKPLTPITDSERAELPELPKEWIWVKVGDNAFVTKLAGFEFTKYVKYKESGDIPVIRAQNVSRYSFIPRNFLYVDREIMEKLPRSRVFGGEILMVFVGAGLGNVGIVPNNQEYFLGPNVAKVALEKQFTTKFIFHFLTSQLGFANVTGMSKATAQGSISMANIREVSVPLISIEEQNYIVEELESKLTVCDKIEETISQSLQQAETLKQSILKRAFEGRL